MDHEYNDNHLVELAKENNEEMIEIIYKKYDPFIKSFVTKMLKYCVNSGIEQSDLYQEGLLGLSKAIKTFNESYDNLFYTYAKNCIEKKIISLIVSTKRLKHKPLNESIAFDEEERVEVATISSPEEQLLENENEIELINSIKSKLTSFEEQVFLLKINGLNYHEIAEVLDKDDKAIDNAQQRIKNKIKEVLKTR